jgi:hypothetical protein
MQQHLAPALGRAADSRRPRPIWEPDNARQGEPDYARPDPPNYAGQKDKRDETLIWAPYGQEAAEPSIDLPPVAPFERDPDAEQPALPAQRKSKAEARAAAKGGRQLVAADSAEDTSARRRRKPAKPAPFVDPPENDPPKRRLGRSLYDAVQTHGHFGMVDTGESSLGIRRVICHVPKNSRGYIMDIKPGEVIHANSGRGRPIGGRLDVQFVTRHQYFAPGRAVTSCAIGVPDYQWERFIA